MEMTRRQFVGSGTAALAAGALPVSAAPAAKPDILLFMVDQLAAQWLWDVKAMALPNFERLRARSATFTNACVSNPVCVPSRASLATGLRTRGHGVLQNGYQLDPAVPTFAGQLQRAGWRTAAFGKLHHRPQFAGVHHDYRPYGFDTVAYTEDARAGFWLDWVAREQPQYYDAALLTINDSVIPELAAYGQEKVNLRERINALRKDYRWESETFPQSDPNHYTLPFPSYVSQTSGLRETRSSTLPQRIGPSRYTRR